MEIIPYPVPIVTYFDENGNVSIHFSKPILLPTVSQVGNFSETIILEEFLELLIFEPDDSYLKGKPEFDSELFAANQKAARNLDEYQFSSNG